jgi:Golgi apparatus protein 1
MNRPCHNGGTCLDGITANENDYQCVCPKGFAGANCETNIDDCALNPCQHGGTCIDFVDDYKCYCLPGFSGTHCEENVNECAINPCANGGTCHDSVNDFVCACPPGYSGKFCSVEINECARSPCMHKGICIDKLNDYECKCLPGYSGKACNVLPDGTVLPLTGHNENEQGPNVTLVVTLSILLTLLMILGCLLIVYKKRKVSFDQRKADGAAKKENELNEVNSANKIKMIEDTHMIVNDLDYPKHKRTNNPNLKSADVYYNDKQCVSKQLNTNSRASLLLEGKLDKDSSCSASYTSSSTCHTNKNRHLNHATLAQFNSECSSSTTSSTGAPSVCSSDSVKSKKYDLPTAASVQAMRNHHGKYGSDDEVYFTEV